MKGDAFPIAVGTLVLDRHTGAIDGGGFSSPGRAYASREHYEEVKRSLATWRAFRTVASAPGSFYPVPARETVMRAARDLGLAELVQDQIERRARR